MRLLQVSVILFSGHHSMHFHTKLNEMQRYVRPRQQQSRIIASLWNCELLLLLSRTWKSCGHFYIHIGTITLWRKWERPSKQTFAKKIVGHESSCALQSRVREILIRIVNLLWKKSNRWKWKAGKSFVHPHRRGNNVCGENCNKI